MFRSGHAAYHRAGVQARLVEALPIKMAIADRRVALIGMRGPLEAVDERTFPTNLLIEDPGMADVLASSFEYLWDIETRSERVDHHQAAPGRPDSRCAASPVVSAIAPAGDTE